jgi:UDPglucose--hexose-1-phosphate uridylyltransferase
VSQLRQDPTTKEWVIIATERSQRPHNFVRPDAALEKPPYKEECPFCQGNEFLTPHESLAYRHGGPADSAGWWVRVVPNRFPALSSDGSLRREEMGFFRMMDGVGAHEVVVESPIHNEILPLMNEGQVEEILLAYRERYLALREDHRIKLIIIFKNHGQAPGHRWSTAIPRSWGPWSSHPESEGGWTRLPATTMTMEAAFTATPFRRSSSSARGS